MLLHLLAADGGVGAPDTGIEQSQVLVDLRRGADGTTGIARDDLLLDGDGRGDALDEIALRLVHSAEELPGIARQALHITALSFGIQCVEG